MYRQDGCGDFKGKRASGWLYRLLLLASMAAGFGALYRFPLSAAEYAVLFAGYLLLLTVLHDIYGAVSAGQFRIAELVLSQTLSNLICAAAVYLCTSLYLHALIAPLPLLIVFAIQELLSAIWSVFANSLYFKYYQPPRTAVVYQDEGVLRQLYETPYFLKKYDVRQEIQSPKAGEALLSQLAECDVIFVADVSEEVVGSLTKYCVAEGKRGFIMPRVGQILLAGAEYVPSFSMPMLMVRRAGNRRAYLAVKRLFDIVASLIGLVLTLPIMLVTALAIWLEDRGPFFYRQKRLTTNGREFMILKFRSMTVNAEKDGVARLAGQNDQRITRVGRFIRACRIDELPQLINILRGDMSIVGPRPERPEIARQYEEQLPEFALRLQVKAGLTGLAQVYGRYNTDPYTKLRMDLQYINEMSVLRDLYLILATVKIVFMKESTQGVRQGQPTALGGAQPYMKSKSA